MLLHIGSFLVEYNALNCYNTIMNVIQMSDHNTLLNILFLSVYSPQLYLKSKHKNVVVHVANNCVFVLDPPVTTTFDSTSDSGEPVLGAAVGTFITLLS